MPKNHRSFIVIRHQFAGFHRWLTAPPESAYLKSTHRHDFKVEFSIEVNHLDRQFEFHIVQKALIAACDELGLGNFEQPASLSCEAIANRLWSIMGTKGYSGFKVSVSEDGQFDGVFETFPDFEAQIDEICKERIQKCGFLSSRP